MEAQRHLARELGPRLVSPSIRFSLKSIDMKIEWKGTRAWIQARELGVYEPPYKLGFEVPFHGAISLAILSDFDSDFILSLFVIG